MYYALIRLQVNDKHYTLLFIGQSPIAFVRCSLSDHVIRVLDFRVDNHLFLYFHGFDYFFTSKQHVKYFFLFNQQQNCLKLVLNISVV